MLFATAGIALTIVALLYPVPVLGALVVFAALAIAYDEVDDFRP